MYGHDLFAHERTRFLELSEVTERLERLAVFGAELMARRTRVRRRADAAAELRECVEQFPGTLRLALLETLALRGKKKLKS